MGPKGEPKSSVLLKGRAVQLPSKYSCFYLTVTAALSFGQRSCLRWAVASRALVSAHAEGKRQRALGSKLHVPNTPHSFQKFWNFGDTSPLGEGRM